MIRFDSDEFKAWHEVGHTTVCLHLGGDIDCIEFLDGDTQAFAVTRGCYVMPDMQRSVACGGFAAEFYLLQVGCVDRLCENSDFQNYRLVIRLPAFIA